MLIFTKRLFEPGYRLSFGTSSLALDIRQLAMTHQEALYRILALEQWMMETDTGWRTTSKEIWDGQFPMYTVRA